MNHRSDIDRVLQIWMADGPTAIPDRVVDVVAARIGVQRQRRSWPFQGRTTVTTPIKLIAGLAAALVVAVVGWQLLPGSGGTGGQPTAAPSPTAAPTRTDQPFNSDSTRTYRPFTSAPDLTMTFDLPPGWSEFDDWAVIGPAGGADPAGVSVVFFEAEGIYSNPCQWDIAGTGEEGQPGDFAVGADALELATALHTNPAYTSAGPPTPVSVGAHAGYAVEIQLPADLDFVGPTCDVVSGDQDGQFVVFGGEDGGFYPQGPGNQWQVSVVDVGDVLLVVVHSYFPGTSADDMAAARSIIESIEIGS